MSPLADDCTTLAVTALVGQLKTENQQVQTLIAQRNEQQAGIDSQAMQRARVAADLVYVETVMVINAFAVVEQQQGVSPYDHAIDVVNQDQEYYVQQVFPKAKLKKVKITDAISFYFTTNETWKKAVEQMGMTWPQLSDLGYWQSAAAGVYGISSIPASILFDGQGKIIATDLRGEKLGEKLQQLYGF